MNKTKRKWIWILAILVAIGFILYLWLPTSKVVPQHIIDLCKKDNEFSESVRSDPDCKNGWRCINGWSETTYYDEATNITIGRYSKSVCNCITPISYHILVKDKLRETTCESFYKFIEDYNFSCNGCVLTSKTECC